MSPVDRSTSSPELDDVIRDVIARRVAGESITDDDLRTRYPHLEPTLSETIAKLSRIDSARQEAWLDRDGDDPSDPMLDSFAPRLLIPGYQLLREVSRGGQAVVYLAVQRETGRRVAIKILRDGVLADERQRERFEREATILASLNHPNIVGLLDRGRTRDGRQLYLAMDYIEGEPLSPEELGARLSLAERLKLFTSICRAVDAAHTRGVVHRDLKPPNIRIDRDGTPHVLDFGLAAATSQSRARESMTMTGEFLGSFLWASPEQAAGANDITPAADVYALGVILHQLLTAGRFPPHVHANVRRAIEPNEANARQRTWRDRAASFPAVAHRGLWPVLSRCLSAEPEHRYQRAGEIADALDALPAKLDRWQPRRAIRVVSVVGVMLLVTVVLAMVAYRATRHEIARDDGWPAEQNGRPPLKIGGVVMIWIPPGEAMLGTPVGAQERLPDEHQHQVRIARGFYMSASEIDQATYERVMGANPSRFKDPYQPVECVNYDDAQTFCQRVSSQSGKRVRLPTEDEWEYACRAGSDTAYHFGDSPLLMQRYGNGADQSNRDPDVAWRFQYNDAFPHTSAMYRFLPNRWGLRDMHGNVWEWCEGPYQSDPSNPATADTTRMPTRGGSWYDGPGSLRSAHRNPLPRDTRNDNVGFRIACDDDD